MKTAASLPGCVPVHYARLLRFRPLLVGHAIAGAALLSVGVTWAVVKPAQREAARPLMALGLLVLFRAVYAVRLERLRFLRGMLLPGVVLADAALVPGGKLPIAVLADMSKGDGRRYDVLAVRAFPAAMFEAGLKRGQRVPLCALFGPGRARGAAHWMRFEPKPVAAVCADPAVQREAVARIPKAEWAALAAAAKSSQDEPGATIRVDVSQITGQPSGWPHEWIGSDLGDGRCVA
jgi:hypothetical protein